jgi:cell division protein FtsQ
MAARFPPVIQTPFDVRLMNATSALLLAAVLLAALAAGLWWWLRNPAFAIQRIVVHGQTTHNDAASLRERVLPRLTGNFFTLDMAQAQAAFQSLPWVERAVVWRRWPGRLDVTLQERQPAARWGTTGARMIDVDGQVFNAAPGAHIPDAALPALTGPDGQSATVLAMYRQLDPLVAPLHARLATLRLEARGSWQAQLTGDGQPGSGPGAALELGSGTPDELAARLQTFVATAPQVAARHQRSVADIETADLRHPDGYALRIRGVGTASAAPDAASAASAARAAAQPAPQGAATAARH